MQVLRTVALYFLIVWNKKTIDVPFMAVNRFLLKIQHTFLTLLNCSFSIRMKIYTVYICVPV